MSMKVVLGDWETLKKDAMQVRLAVFVIEQAIPEEEEIDDFDASCLHAVVYSEAGVPVATGRLRSDGRIGRMAVLHAWRGKGLGALLMEQLTLQARQNGVLEVIVSAQTDAQGFYEKAGFTVVGKPYQEVNIEHVSMHRALTI